MYRPGSIAELASSFNRLTACGDAHFVLDTLKSLLQVAFEDRVVFAHREVASKQ